MKKLLLPLVALLVFSCSAPKNIIIGNVEGLEKGDKVFLVMANTKPYTVIDSVVVVQDGNFQIETPITDAYVEISIAKNTGKRNLYNSAVDFFLEGFSTVNIDGNIIEDINDLEYSKITGGLYATPEMREYSILTDSANVIQREALNKMNEANVLAKSKALSQDSIKILFDGVMKMFDKSNGLFSKRSDLENDFRAKNPDVAYSAYVLRHDYYARQKGVNNIDSLYNLMSPRVRASLAGKSVEDYISAIRATAIGATAPDFKGRDVIDGEHIALSDYKGKYLFVAFWHRHCGGSVQSIPYVISMYEKLKGEDFEFISIASGETDEEAMIKNINDNKLVWRHINDEDGAIGESYASQGVPDCFFIDPQGKILKRGHPLHLYKDVIKVVQENRKK